MGKIITLGDQLLRERSEGVAEFDKQIKDFCNDMFEIMGRHKGVGLAAVQVGILQRIFIVSVTGDKPRIFINPEIIETSLEQGVYEEGCLSVPGVNAEIVRSAFVKIQAFNERGRHYTIDADGLLARVIQHEYDHLNGTLFIDHLEKDKQERLVRQYTRKSRA